MLRTWIADQVTAVREALGGLACPSAIRYIDRIGDDQALPRRVAARWNCGGMNARRGYE